MICSAGNQEEETDIVTALAALQNVLYMVIGMQIMH